MEEKARAPFLIAAGVAPLLWGMVSLGVVLGVLGTGVPEALAAGGWGAYALIPIAGLAVVSMCVLLFVRARGIGIPVALIALPAVAPWLTGLAAMQSGLKMMMEAVAVVNPLDKGTIIAAGAGEASVAAFLGYALSIGTLGGAAIGLACAALARPTALMRGVGALGGLALALPAIGSAFWGSAGSGAGVLSLGVGATSLGVASALAGATVAADEPHPSDVVAALCGAALAALGLVASFGAPFAEITYQAGRAAASVDPEMRAAILAHAGALAAHLQSARQWGIPFAFLPTAALLVASGRRLNATALAPIGLTAALIGLCFWQRVKVEAIVPALAERLSKLPWADASGFQAIRACPQPPEAVVQAVVMPEEWRTVDERPVSMQESDERLVKEMSVLAPARRGQRPRNLGEDDIDAAPALVVAVDRRVAGASLQRLLRLAGEAGYHSVRIAGLSGEGPVSPPASALPIAGLATPLGLSAPVLLAGAVAEGVPEQDPILWHGRLGAEPLQVQHRPGSDVDADDQSVRPAYVELTSTAEAAGLVRASQELAVRHLSLVAVIGALPGHPDQPLRPDSAGKDSDIDKEAIRRVVTRHAPEVRSCYEKALSRSATLAGKIVFEFEILPSGRVGAHRVEAHGLEDPEMERCLDSVLAGWRFPAFEGPPAQVSYPFVFTPSP
jgi:hypothetical protein